MSRAAVGFSLAIPCLLVASGVGAQVAAFGVESMALPLHVRGHVEGSRMHGCSQSVETTRETIDIELTIDAPGDATLRLTRDHVSTMGPSPHRYMQGDHEFTRTTTLSEARYFGRVVESGDTLQIALDRREVAEVRFTGYGSLPLPSATSMPFAGTMTCRIEEGEVFPASAREGESGTATSLLACSHTIADYAPFVLGADVGVRTVRTSTMWGPDTTTLRVPE